MDVVEEFGKIEIGEKEESTSPLTLEPHDRGDLPASYAADVGEMKQEADDLSTIKTCDHSQEITKSKSANSVIIDPEKRSSCNSFEDKQTYTEIHFLQPELLTPPGEVMIERPASNVQTQTKDCCSKEGHVCFDCFPIPDELLQQLHLQIGLSKLACLQAVQTVVKFYKHDLVCSKYYAYEASGLEDRSQLHSQSAGFNESSLLFSTHLSPRVFPSKHVTKETTARCLESESDEQFEKEEEFYRHHRQPPRSAPPPLEAPVVSKPLKLCGADQFRNLVRRLKYEPGNFWIDTQNASFVFAFFRKFNKIVVALDRSLLKKLIIEDNFEFVWILTKFLRRETRWSIQWEILGLIGTVATRDSRTKMKLLESDFPVYLSSGILDPMSDSPKVGAYAELLTVLFTGGKPLPVFLIEHFGLKFVSTVLDILENDDSRPGWALPDVLIKLLISYNLQFNSNDVYDNITILAIARMGICKTLTSRLIDWLDQKDCPVTYSWEVTVSVHQCVVKMITDIFLCRTTSHIFSVSQAILLIRLLTSKLGNFLAGDRRRTSYLKLIQTILRHCKYDYVRNVPSLKKLEEILLETGSLSARDQEVIRNIFKDFPQLQPESI